MLTEWLQPAMPYLALSVLLAIGLVLAAVVVTLALFHHVTHPPRLTAGAAAARGWWIDPSDAGFEFDEWTLDLGTRGRIPVWEIDHPTDLDGPVVIVTHDWGESRIASLQRVPSLLPHAARVTLWDLPGHGEVPEKARHRGHGGPDEREILIELINRSAENRPVILYGKGLGARLAVDAGHRSERVFGVIVEAPAASIQHEIDRVRRRFDVPRFPVAWLVRWLLQSVSRDLGATDLDRTAPRLAAPLLVMPAAPAGSDVRRTAEMMAERSGGSTEYLDPEGAGEGMTDLLLEADPMVEGPIGEFIRTCEARAQQERRSGATAGGTTSTSSFATPNADEEILA